MNGLIYKLRPLQVFIIVLTIIITTPKEGIMSTYGGVEYIGNNLEIRKVISVGNMRDGAAEWEELKRREKESKPTIDALGKELDAYFMKLRSKGTPYPWISELLIDYQENTPNKRENYKGENISIDISHLYASAGKGYLGENRNRMPEFVCFRVKEDPWLPVKELLSCIVIQWLFEYDKKNLALREKSGEVYFNEFMEKEPNILVTDSLFILQYTQEYIQKFKKVALGSDAKRRLISLTILGRGFYIEDPTFFGNFLDDKDKDIRREAMIALFLIPDDKGLEELKNHFNHIIELFEEYHIESLKSYLSIKK